MGLFDFLKKKDSGPIIQDLVWINQKDKMRGCLNIVEENPNLMLVAWSTLTQQWFQDYLSKETGRTITIELASYLNSSSETVYFLEHHPQLSKEELLFDAVKIPKAVFLNALDDHLMEMFGSTRIAKVMDRMGLKEGEVIEHLMITKSIRNAQKKMDESGVMENQNSKFQEWLDSIKDY